MKRPAVAILLLLSLTPVSSRAADAAPALKPASALDTANVREAIGEDEALLVGPMMRRGNAFTFDVNASKLTHDEKQTLLGPILTQRSKEANDVINAVYGGERVTLWVQQDGADTKLTSIGRKDGPLLSVQAPEPTRTNPVDAPAAGPGVEPTIRGMSPPNPNLQASIRVQLLEARRLIADLPAKPPVNAAGLMRYDVTVRNIAQRLSSVAPMVKDQIMSGRYASQDLERSLSLVDRGQRNAAQVPMQVQALTKLSPDARGKSTINPFETLRSAYIDINRGPVVH